MSNDLNPAGMPREGYVLTPPSEPFREFSKIPRLSRQMIVTEKIDGTNASVRVTPVERVGFTMAREDIGVITSSGESFLLRAGSRTRWLSLEQDNFGFFAWVLQNCQELVRLGEGHHFGEWWGRGIQRGYGLEERRFSLFNVSRWRDPAVRPACCHVVPVLLEGGVFNTNDVDDVLNTLSQFGSLAAPGWPYPEGVIVYHVAGNLMFKKTLEKDNEPKGKTR